MSSAHAGLCLLNDPGKRALYMFNHIEYDTDTLGAEYARDVEAGKDTQMPLNYFPDDMPRQEFYRPAGRGAEKKIRERLAWFDTRRKNGVGE